MSKRRRGTTPCRITRFFCLLLPISELLSCLAAEHEHELTESMIKVKNVSIGM